LNQPRDEGRFSFAPTTIATRLTPANKAMMRALHDFSGRDTVLRAGHRTGDQAALHRLRALTC
jgi:hypothetical protein